MFRKVNVLHLITKLEIGGAQKHTIHTVEKLDKTKYNVFLVSSNDGPLNDYARGLNEVTFVELSELKREISFFNDIRVIFKIVKLLKKYKIDIVHTNSSKAGIVGRLAARIARTPVIIHTVHGFGFHDYQSAMIKQLYVNLERFNSRFTDKLITVSEFTSKKGLVNRIATEEKYITIHSGINIQSFSNVNVNKKSLRESLGIKDDVAVVGNVGNFKPQKNPLDFVKMANIVVKKFPQTKFLLIGDGELRDDIERLIQKYNLQNNMILTGWRNDIPELMSIIDILVLSSLWEGLPQVFPQAMASGKPIVATNVDGAPEAVEHGVNGYLVNPKDYNNLAFYVMKLLGNPTLAKEMGIRGKAKVFPTFCVNSMVADISTVYDKILKEKGIDWEAPKIE